jgi:hypothetical protein
MIYEREDDLGYSTEALHDCPFCGRWDGAHLFGCPVREPGEFEEGTYELCNECGGEAIWRHPEHGPQPCLNCIDSPGLIPHTCASEGD